ncbi:MAG: hypothetical protein ABSF34_21230, partial [Verrucomicrobiota bacterium]
GERCRRIRQRHAQPQQAGEQYNSQSHRNPLKKPHKPIPEIRQNDPATFFHLFFVLAFVIPTIVLVGSGKCPVELSSRL